MVPPANPKIYHITHINHLAGILQFDTIYSDAKMIQIGGAKVTVGMDKLKKRRLGLPVHCHPNTYVGNYVPFYFCPRSVMLFILHRGNHHEVSHKEGQRPIVHLEADLYKAIKWAEDKNQLWAFSLSNAAARYTEFRKDVKQLADINWNAVKANDFRDKSIQEQKQAEFLLYEKFPWHLIERIGVISENIRRDVQLEVKKGNHFPLVEVKRDWYF